MEQKSIYSFIQEILETMPAIPYEFQNSSVNGFKEADYLLKDRFDIDLPDFLGHKSEFEILKYSEKEDLSKKLIDLIMLYILDSQREEEIRDFLYRNPLYTFMDVFQNKFRSYMNFEDFDRKSVYNMGLSLAMNSIDYELTALGILILGFYNNDFSKKVIRVLGLHSMFTSYAIEAYRNFPNCNDLIFDLVKNTVVYGKALALASFSPISIEEMDWTIMHGGTDIYLSELCSALILQKPEVRDSLCDYVSEEKYISSVSELFAYVLNKSSFSDLDWTNRCFEDYLKAVSEKEDFMTLASFIAIEQNLSKRHECNPEDSSVCGWNFRHIFILSKQIKSLIDSKNWKNTVLSALREDSVSPNTMIEVLKRLNIKPDFEEIEKLLSEDSFNANVADFIFNLHPDKYLRDGLEYTKEELSNPFSHLLISSDKGLLFTAEHQENVWIISLLDAMNRMNINDEYFFLECLESKSVEVRLSALKCLRDFSKGWSNEVMRKLELLVHYDSSSIVRREMKKLIAIGKSVSKIRRYVDTSEYAAVPSSDDVNMFQTYIVGTLYHDISEAEREIKKGTVLYLVEQESKTKVLIAVTTQAGYVIGYIPEEDSDMIIPLIESGNVVYGIFEGESITDPEPTISVMINKKVYREQGIIPFSFNRLH